MLPQLLNKEQNVQECDATMQNSSNIARLIMAVIVLKTDS